MVEVLKSKIHNAKITETRLDYEGSISIDKELVEKANFFPGEKVLVVDINNGARFETYVIIENTGRRVIGINGAAVRLVHPGDRIIIMSFALMTPEEAKEYKPVIVRLDENNEIVE